MSTDMVAFIKAPELHSLGDLFTPFFMPMNPLILTNLPSYGFIKNSKPTRPLGLLNERLNRNPNSSLVNFNFDDIGSIMASLLMNFEGVQKGQLCLVTTDYIVTVLRMSLCTLRPELVSGLYLSSSFAQGLMTSFYNKALPPHSATIFEYKGRNFHEMAILGQIGLNAMKFNIADRSPYPLNWKSFKCFHDMKDKEDGIEKSANIKLAFSAVRNLLLYAFYAFSLAMVVLSIECIVHPKKKTKRKRIKRKRDTHRAQVALKLSRIILTSHH